MNGIEKITGRIEGDAQKEIDALLADARAQAADLTAQYDAQAQATAADLLKRGERAARERVERLASMAQMEARKHTLAVEQEVVEQAFNQALIDLVNLPEAEYVAFLANLAVKAARTGREQVILSPSDHDKVGRQVVSAANEILAKRAAPKLPEELKSSTAGAILDKVVTVGSALLAGTGMLSLADETRPILGGLILRDGDVEVNCTVETLVRLQRDEMAIQVAKVLFD